MTDLQCPATAVLVDDGSDRPSWLARLPVAASLDVREPCDVVALVEETADRFRGETFVVAAPAAAIIAALGRRDLRGTVPIVVEVDSEGWRAVPPPEPGATARRGRRA